MKIVLKENVPGVGEMNEVCDVAVGYARNYLFPRGLAVPATKAAVLKAKKFAERRKLRRAKSRTRAELVAQALQGKIFTFRVKAGETGRLYGSITSQDVTEAIEKVLGVDFDKRQVVMEQPLRELGEQDIELKLGEGVSAQVRVVIKAEE
ncbi:MAG TPA: 50S ribosomal protein L9 [Thermoflexia bacterium]|nr:50S ribosomal protein L9 [Thermoflexia bacterium]